jgi:hypothetical protein
MLAALLFFGLFFIILNKIVGEETTAFVLKGIIGVVILCALFTGITGIYDLTHDWSPQKHTVVNSVTPLQESNEQVQSNDGATEQVQPSESSKGQETFSGWKNLSDCYTWNRAPEEDKRELCERLAAQSRSGKSAQLFYEALNAAYDTQNAGVLEQTLRI